MGLITLGWLSHQYLYVVLLVLNLLLESWMGVISYWPISGRIRPTKREYIMFWYPKTYQICLELGRLTRAAEESIIVPNYNGNKTDCSHYRGISPLSAACKSVSNILLSSLSPYVNENVGEYQFGFGRNRSNTVQLFCIRHILEDIVV